MCTGVCVGGWGAPEVRRDALEEEEGQTLGRKLPGTICIWESQFMYAVYETRLRGIHTSRSIS